jgi:ATP-dependent DNA helicase RecQ
VLIYSAADFLKWRMMLERNGELTDARRSLLRDMERYAAGVGCRHRHLVSYFGEPYVKEGCGACDYCLGELEAVAEPATVARKILSCVARVGQRFGAAHVANVLCGSESEQIASRGHQRLSTFGLLREASAPEVRAYIEQLMAEGLLRQTDDQYPVLALTEDGVSLLKDPAARPDLSLARQRRVTREARADRRRQAPVGGGDVDDDLFDRLRAVRLRLARARNVPPYVIFHDTTLRELARVKPTSVAELSGIYGIGESKAARFGDAFVEEIVRAPHR